MSIIVLLKLKSNFDPVGEGESGMGMGDLASLNVKTNVVEAEGVGSSYFFKDSNAKVFS